jgi:membrane-associated protease RseP (regulator of RpoE activity)
MVSTDLALRRTSRVVVKTELAWRRRCKYGWEYNWMWLRLTGVAFQQIFTGRRSARDAVGGPVKIAQETMNTYEVAGWAGTIKLMGMLSLNLGVIQSLCRFRFWTAG